MAQPSPPPVAPSPFASSPNSPPLSSNASAWASVIVTGVAGLLASWELLGRAFRAVPGWTVIPVFAFLLFCAAVARLTYRIGFRKAGAQCVQTFTPMVEEAARGGQRRAAKEEEKRYVRRTGATVRADWWASEPSDRQGYIYDAATRSGVLRFSVYLSNYSDMLVRPKGVIIERLSVTLVKPGGDSFHASFEKGLTRVNGHGFRRDETVPRQKERCVHVVDQAVDYGLMSYEGASRASVYVQAVLYVSAGGSTEDEHIEIAQEVLLPFVVTAA